MVKLRFFNTIRMLEVWQDDEVGQIQADCDVRNELNGRRPLHDPSQVVYGITHNPYKTPVMPREFPQGRWQVFPPVARTDEYLAPFYIPTSAEQWLEVWELDEDGGYDHPTGEMVLDFGYGAHCSTSPTTVGCIKIYREVDLLWARNILVNEFDRDRKVWLEA